MMKTRPRVPLRERFLARLVVAEDGCWLWQGHLDHGGYGEISPGGAEPQPRLLAHRVAYELFVGPIPNGLTIDHLCRNPACVNPDHLEAVTIRENILRGEGVAAVNARKTHCSRGHEFNETNSYVDRRGKRVCRPCFSERRAGR